MPVSASIRNQAGFEPPMIPGVTVAVKLFIVVAFGGATPICWSLLVLGLQALCLAFLVHRDKGKNYQSPKYKRGHDGDDVVTHYEANRSRTT